MAMSRKQFNLLAESLKQLKRDLDAASADGIDNALDFAWAAHCKRIADICGASSDTFSRSRFLEACKV